MSLARSRLASASVPCAARRRACAGFTLIELVVMTMIAGVLAIAVIPRFFDRKDFEARGFHDQTLAALHYAQKAAIAQRRAVCVAFTASTVTLTVASTAGNAACPGSVPLAGPDGIAPMSVAAKAGVAFTTTPAGFAFDALGRAALSAARQRIQVGGAPQAITVERDTGYAHE